ncbi:MAG: matrixin family metalloprotease [Pirellulales bacterium]|nr:matrixin family metalloprotease [Pirellulales bacterium]
MKRALRWAFAPSLYVAVSTFALLATGLSWDNVPACARNITWQGGSGSWKNANWNVDGAVNQTIGNSNSNTEAYSGDDFFLPAGTATITSAEQITINGGSWTQSSGTLDIDSPGDFSALNIGQSGAASTVALSGTASWNLTGSGNAGRTLKGNEGTLTLSDSASILINPGNNSPELELLSGFSLTMNDASAVTTQYIQFGSAGSSNSFFTLSGGTLTLNSNNPVRADQLGSGVSNRINFTGGEGDAQIVHTNNTLAGKTLASKMATGFFAIDGVVVSNTSTFVNDKRFEIINSGTTDTLSLIAKDAVTLQVFVDTGEVKLINRESTSLDFDYYEITSLDLEQDGGSLDPVAWESLFEQDLPAFPAGNGSGNGWEQGGNINDTNLIESYLLSTSSLDAGESVSLGQAFVVGAAQDLTFEYHVVGEDMGAFGAIEYLLSADFDEDGDVDADDLADWRSGFGKTGNATHADGDANGDRNVDGSDFLTWQRQYGATAASAAAAAVSVPEPSAFLLLAMAAYFISTQPVRVRRRTNLLHAPKRVGTFYRALRGNRKGRTGEMTALELKRNLIRSCFLGAMILGTGVTSAWGYNLSGSRWTNTITDGGGIQRGDAITLLWSVVPDGEGYSLAGNSQLIDYLDDGWNVASGNRTPDLTNRPWWSWMDRVYDQYSRVSGITMTYVPEQNANGSDSGQFGDIRIGGVPFTWDQGGAGGVLADNAFPNNGDMRIDTNLQANGNPSWWHSNGAPLRNLISHESGHGVGLDHSNGISGANAVMETPLQTGFWGLQFDDIYAINRYYGDPLEKNGGNDVFSSATYLGNLGTSGSVTRGTDATDAVVQEMDGDWTGIDGTSDTDWFRFSVTDSSFASIAVTPVGPNYTTGNQGNFVASARSDLEFDVFASNGTTLLASANEETIGHAEELGTLNLPSAGDYLIRIKGQQNSNQFYQLDVSVSELPLPGTTADINLNGVTDFHDWIDFKAGQGADMIGLTGLAAFQMGDLDHDFDNDVNDLLLFKSAYDGANGDGRFASLLLVPEPHTWTLACGMVLAGCGCRFRRLN